METLFCLPTYLIYMLNFSLCFVVGGFLGFFEEEQENTFCNSCMSQLGPGGWKGQGGTINVKILLMM